MTRSAVTFVLARHGAVLPHPYTDPNLIGEEKTTKVELSAVLQYRNSKQTDTEARKELVQILCIMLTTVLTFTLAILSFTEAAASRTFDIVATVRDGNKETRVEYRMREEREEKRNDPLNNRPIIGVLSQELDEELYRKLPKGHNYTAYIAASYVKWIEAGGARAVPIIIGKTEDYYRKLFNGLNGVLLPGGSAPLTGRGGYAEVGQLFFKWAKEANDAGDYFPIWGTCNGFELLTVLSVKDDKSRLTDCYSEDQALPLNLRGRWQDSKIYGNLPPHILRDLTEKPVTINFHHFCLTPTNFTRYGLHHFWMDLSINEDSNGLTYISTIEAKNYPFIGTQFHPEKNGFEWVDREPNIPHSESAVNVASYMSRFLVNMARRSHHSFTQSEEREYLIYNYSPVYSDNEEINTTFQQMYLF